MAQNDCPQDQLVIYLPDRDSVIGVDIPLLGPTADLPEFHDCQRFLVTAGSPTAVSEPSADRLAFGPLVAIWAAYELESTFVDVEPGDGQATAVAVIYDFDRAGGYSALDLSPGFNCLYLWSDSIWHAAIRPLGNHKSAPSSCDGRREIDVKLLAASASLKVKTATLGDGLTAADIPPVARWDWDAANREQYINIRCGDQWCQVGSSSFTPAPGALHASLTEAQIMALPDIKDRANGPSPEPILRVFAVKGWYDEQRLDLPGSPNPQIPRLTDVVGTAFPHPTLASATFDSGTWTTVAYLRVSDDYEGVVPLNRGISRLQMCRGDAKGCGAEPGKTCSLKEQAHLDPWWGRTISQAGDTSVVGCVRRRNHEGLAIPAAAARWNYSELDAKTWSACGGGCCVLN